MRSIEAFSAAGLATILAALAAVPTGATRRRPSRRQAVQQQAAGGPFLCAPPHESSRGLDHPCRRAGTRPPIPDRRDLLYRRAPRRSVLLRQRDRPKGATHEDDDAASHKWLDAMAVASLDYPELVHCAFESGKNIAGAFRSHGLWSFPGYHDWHFAGTWFTFRHSRVLELDWRNVHPDFMGVEAWPGILPLAESACLFF